MRTRPFFFLSLGIFLLVLAGWWLLTGRSPAASESLLPSRLGTRGDALVSRLSRRLGTLWRPNLPAPDQFPLSAAKRLALYSVVDGKLDASAQQRIPHTHQRSWNTALRLLPTELTNNIQSFGLATDGRGSSRGWLTPPKPGMGWQLDLDPRDSGTVARLNTLVYQSAFLSALAPSQLQTLPEGDLCPTVLTSAGCVQAGSLMHRYVRTFWSDAMLKDWRQRKVAEQPQQARAFFAAYPQQFLNVGAARGPEQDFAMSWTAFILKPQPTQTKTAAQRKVAFFYSDPQLVALRLQLLRRISDAFPAKS